MLEALHDRVSDTQDCDSRRRGEAARVAAEAEHQHQAAVGRPQGGHPYGRHAESLHRLQQLLGEEH